MDCAIETDSSCLFYSGKHMAVCRIGMRVRKWVKMLKSEPRAKDGSPPPMSLHHISISSDSMIY